MKILISGDLEEPKHTWNQDSIYQREVIKNPGLPKTQKAMTKQTEWETQMGKAKKSNSQFPHWANKGSISGLAM